MTNKEKVQNLISDIGYKFLLVNLARIMEETTLQSVNARNYEEANEELKVTENLMALVNTFTFKAD